MDIQSFMNPDEGEGRQRAGGHRRSNVIDSGEAADWTERN